MNATEKVVSSKNKIISKGKSFGVKRGLWYLDEFTTPNSGKTNFVKTKKVIPIVQTPTRAMYTCSFCHINGYISNRCHIRKFEEIHFDRKRKNTQWVSKTLTQFKHMMNIHDSYIATSNSSFGVLKTRQIWIRKDVLVELQNKGLVNLLLFYSYRFS